MLDRDIYTKMKAEGKTPEEMKEYFDKACRYVTEYMYGKKNGPSRLFKFDAMSFRAWVYALSKVFDRNSENRIDVVKSLYIGTVISPKAAKKKVADIGKIAAQTIDDYAKRGTIFGLRTDVATCINYDTDETRKGLKRRLLGKNFPDIDAKIIMHQFFSPFADYLFHLVEVPDPTKNDIVRLKVLDSNVVNEEHYPSWAVEAVNSIINRFETAEIIPHHPQYVEHALTGLNFEITLVRRPSGKIELLDATAVLNKNWSE